MNFPDHCYNNLLHSHLILHLLFEKNFNIYPSEFVFIEGVTMSGHMQEAVTAWKMQTYSSNPIP